MNDCACDPRDRMLDERVENAPGQAGLRWRVATTASSLARMRAALADEDAPMPVRVLAGQSSEDLSVALLDAWAVVADVVSFYTERAADEGFLRTATERRSVRELARTLGYELRPGVAAETALAFAVEDAAGAPEVVQVPAGTPVQSIPGQDALPQVFETGTALEARAAWNAVPAVTTAPQAFVFDRGGGTDVWLAGTGHGVRKGDGVLVVGAERRAGAGAENWDFRTVDAVVEEPAWTRLALHPGIGFRADRELIARTEVTVHAFRARASLFGWTAPDPRLLTGGDGPPGGTTADGTEWGGFGVTAPGTTDVLELDGDQPQVLPGSWLVLRGPSYTELYAVRDADPGGAARYAVSGKLTRVRLDTAESLDRFSRRSAVAHCASAPLPAQVRPRDDAVEGLSLELVATEPPLPVGRLVLVTGADALTGEPRVERGLVAACTTAGASMTVTLAERLAHRYDRASVAVRANVVAATHGETVRQVLGSGDGRTSFASFRLARVPLTKVRAPVADGARSTLTVRVDGAAWAEVASLADAGPADRVYVLRDGDGGGPHVVFGDGRHGARLPTGAENVVAEYRVGLGRDGAVPAGAVTLLARRPLGIREVVNPAASSDWADAETLDDARRNAPQRVRTLDRVVSVEDHADLARGFAGVGRARADLVWDGQRSRVVVSVLGPAGAAVGDGLLADLRSALADSRDDRERFDLLRGVVREYAARLDLRTDPSYDRKAVEAALVAAVEGGFGAAAADFGGFVSGAQVLVAARAVPGVVACTVPELVALPGTDVQPVLVALPGRAEPSAQGPEPPLRAAELLALRPGSVQVGVLAP